MFIKQQQIANLQTLSKNKKKVKNKTSMIYLTNVKLYFLDTQGIYLQWQLKA